ncbi:hypothetical protein Lesp02_22950 [Lentzea sp. NBRC 105346]|nr:hypothetical protein Lesp02_22950 [Lentzea sp. NBRC 105346]
MQEAVLLLDADRRVEMVNRAAADLLGDERIVGRTISEFLPEDTAAVLGDLCDKVTEPGACVEHFAAAPDPLTDLGRAPSISVRVARVDDVVLCTWLPGWVGDGGDHEQVTAADRMELAKAADALGDTGFGLFSLDLMSGRLIGSSGLRVIFGESDLESAVSGSAAWRALITRGEPMDVEIELDSERRVRVTGRVEAGADGHPAVVRGLCSVVRS